MSIRLYTQENEEITDFTTCFVCGKILVKDTMVHELAHYRKHIGNICSKPCIDKYWRWWDQEYHRKYADDFAMEANSQ